MAHGTVIVGLSEGEWLTLATPATPVPEAKALYREIKINGGRIDGVDYDEVRKYSQQGCQRLRFKGAGILDVNIGGPAAVADEPGDDDRRALDEAVFAANKKELQDLLGLDDELFKALWDAEGRPEKETVGYNVDGFMDFGIAQGIIKSEPDDSGTGQPE